jgi:hypothetical protein
MLLNPKPSCFGIYIGSGKPVAAKPDMHPRGPACAQESFSSGGGSHSPPFLRHPPNLMMRRADAGARWGARHPPLTPTAINLNFLIRLNV